jgi:hypothetical protein
MELTPIETMAVENAPAYGQGWYARSRGYWAGRAIWAAVTARLASAGSHTAAMAVAVVFAAATAAGLAYMHRRSSAVRDRMPTAPLPKLTSPAARSRLSSAELSSLPLSIATALALTPALGGVFLWMLGESLLPHLRSEESWRYRTDQRVMTIYEHFGTSPEMSAGSAADRITWWGSEMAPDDEPAIYHSFARSRMDYSARPTPATVEAEQTAICGATTTVKCGLGTARWLVDTYGTDLSVCPACQAMVGSQTRLP